VTEKDPSGKFICWYPDSTSRNREKIGNTFKTKRLALVAYNHHCVKKNDDTNLQMEAWGSTINSIKDYDKRQKYYDLVKPKGNLEAKKYKGVIFHHKKGKFEGKVKENGRQRSKTFETAREAAEGVDSFSVHVERQKYPLNFPGQVSRVIPWPKKPNLAKGGRNAIKAQVEYRKKQPKKRASKKKKKAVKKSPKKKAMKKEQVKKENKLVSAVECPICLDVMVGPVSLSCGHGGCERCIADWLRNNRTCPICRKRPRCKPVLNLTLRNLIADGIVPLAHKDDRDDWEERKEAYDAWKSG